MEKILELAKRLGREIAANPIGTRYAEASKKLDKDPDAQKLIKEYEAKAQEIAKKEREQKPVEPEEKHALQEMQTQIAEHDTIKTWMQSQVEYVNLLRKVNEAVMGVAGENTNEE